MRGATNPYDIQSIPRMPEGLQIYRIPASAKWQVRLFVGRKYVRRSAHCTDKRDAIEFAKQFYDEIALNCGQMKIDFVEVDIQKGYDSILNSYLIKRSRMR